MDSRSPAKPISNRRSFIGGSDARIIMGSDEERLVRLWREKKGEVQPEDLGENLIVQLGSITEDLNRRWYERNTGNEVEDVQRQVWHPIHKWMAATLDGRVKQSGAVFEAKFMLPWNFSEEAAVEKHMAQLQHNMWVTAARSAVLSIITGGGKWVEITLHADPLYQHLLLTAEKKFWRCVQTGEQPCLFGARGPTSTTRSSENRGYALIQLMGGAFRKVPGDAGRAPGSRTCQGRIEKARSGRRQRGRRTWITGQAVKIGGDQLRCCGYGRRKCTTPVSASGLLQLPSPKRSPS